MEDQRSMRLLAGAVGVLLAAAVLGTEAAAGAPDRFGPLSDSLAASYGTPFENVEPLAPTARLEDYLIYAAKQSPGLRAAFYEWQAALGRSGYVGALPNPQLTYTHFIENVETRVGPQERRIGLRQMYPWFGTLDAREDIAAEAAKAAYERFESEKLSLFYSVKAAYYEYYYLNREIKITEENFQLLKFWESVARAKYRVALKQHPDVIKAQVELGKLEDRLYTVRDMAAPAAARLRAVANIPNGVDLPAPDSIWVEEVEVDPDSTLAEVYAHNPDLKALEHVIEKARVGRRLAGKASWPDFFVGVDYVETGEALIPNQIDSGKDAWMATVGVSLPIWFGANKAKRDQADARYRGARNRYMDARNRLYALTEKVLFDYEDAMRKTRLYRDGLVPKAEQSLNANYTAYQAGETDFLNLLDAQRQLLDFQLMYERSRANLATSRAEIEMITGHELALPKDE